MAYVYIPPKHSRYTRKGVLSLTHIFPNVPETALKYIKRKKGAQVKLQRKYMVHDNSQLVRFIFTAFLKKVLMRVLDGDMFMFPGTTKIHLVIKSKPDKSVRYIRQHGNDSTYDIVAAGFKMPELHLDFGPFSRHKDMLVHISYRLFRYMLRMAELGKYSWITIPKTLDKDVRDERYYAGDL